MTNRVSPSLSALLVLGVLLDPHSAVAQERLEIFASVDGQLRLIELDATVSGFGQVRHAQPLPAGAVPGSQSPFLGSPTLPVVLAGGRYVLWTPQYGSPTLPGSVLALDRRTRRVLDASQILPRDWHGYPVSGVSLAGVDSHRPRVFFSSEYGQGIPQRYALWMLDLDTLTSVQLRAGDFRVGAGAYAAGPDELSFWEMTLDASRNTTRWIVTVDATTGVEKRRWLHPEPPSPMYVSPDGTFLWLNRAGGLSRVDAATGSVLAHSDQFAAAYVTPDFRRGLLLVRQGDFLVAADALTLVEVGRVRVAYSPPVPDRVFTSQSIGGRWMTGAYTLRGDTRVKTIASGRTGRFDVVETTCGALEVDALAANGVRRASTSLLTGISHGTVTTEREFVQACAAIAVAVMSPFAPDSLGAVVGGQTVSLSWNDPGDTQTFELEFGFAPGQRAGAVRVGRATALTIPGVPPGTYYLRVKAVNEVGTGPASNEVAVTVP